jgi:hypothetical protein
MAGDESLIRIDESSPEYAEVSRLYRLAHELRPGVADRWNGELYARTDDKWGGLHPNGSLRLSRDLVLRHLSGSARIRARRRKRLPPFCTSPTTPGRGWMRLTNRTRSGDARRSASTRV